MGRFHLVFVVFYFGGLSILTGAAPDPSSQTKIDMGKTQQVEVVGKIIDLIQKTVNDVSGGKSAGHSVVDVSNSSDAVLGVSQILYLNEGPLCTGIHLKPWIVLTTADCVKDRDVSKLVVQVTRLDSGSNKFITSNVEVDKVTTDPRFKLGVEEKNPALLHIYARFEWRVDEFSLPINTMSNQDIINLKIQTYTNHWNRAGNEENKYYAVVNEKPLTAEFGYCGELTNIAGQFCAVKKDGEDTMYKVDTATPLYYYDGKLKRLIGIFSGQNFNQSLKGHLYQAIYSFVDWIEEYIHEHSLPPFGY